MKEKENYEGENQPLTEPDKREIIESAELSQKVLEKISSHKINYKLPSKQKIKFNLDFNNKINNLGEKDIEILNKNKEYLESKLWYWKIDSNFKFNLPHTIFKEKKFLDGSIGFKYTNKDIQYKDSSIIGKHFSKDILSQIWLKGEFNISSTVPDFPYTWHLTECMIKGYEKLKLSYFNILSASFMFLYSLKYRFYSEDYKDFCSFSIFSSFYHLYIAIIRLIELFFGVPSYFINESAIKKEIMNKRIANFINQNSDFDFDFFNEEIKNKLKIFDEKFEKKWIEEINPSLINQYKDCNKKEMINILKNKKLEEYLNFLKKDEQFLNLEKFHPSAKDYLNSQQVINDKNFYNNLEKNKKLNEYEKQLKNNYVRYLCNYWREEKLNTFKNKLEKETEEKIQKEIKNEIKDKKDPLAIYTFNIINKNENKELFEKYSKKHKIPKVKIDITKYNCCYKKLEYLCPNGEVKYKLEKETNHQIESTFYFWRIVFYILKYFYDFWNFNICIGRNMVNSMFGLKALCLIELYRDYDINSSTGEKIKIKKLQLFLEA